MSRRGWLALLAGAVFVAVGGFLARSFLADDGAPDRIAPTLGRSDGAHGDGGSAAKPAAAQAWDPRLPPQLLEPTAPDAARLEETGEFRHLELRVRVVDRAGAGVAGTPVALGTLDSKLRRPRAVARSGDDGLAHLTGYDDALRAERPGADWCVYFPFPEAQAHITPVDPWHPSSEPIELVAPELGRLIVRVTDAAGAPVRTAGELTLFGWPAGASEGKGARPAPLSLPLTSPCELVVDPIATGVHLRVDAWLAEYPSASTEGDGPRRPGETATLTLVIPRHGPIVTGQLFGPDGRPVAATRLTGIVHDDPQLRMPMGDVQLASDGEGRFRFDASKYEIDEPGTPRWLDLVGVVGEGKWVSIDGRARAALPVPFAAGDYDVGRVDYELAPVVVSGRVVDEGGKPAAEARVCVGPTTLTGVEGLRAGGAGDVLWQGADADGAFEVHGFVGPEERSLFAIDGRKRESAPCRFAPGARDVTLLVRGCGGLEGSLVMDPTIHSIHIGLFLRRADAPGGGRGPFEMVQPPAQDATFRWNRVVAGRVDVAVGIGRYTREPEIVLVVPDVEVKADVVNRDPRITGIDLRSRIPKARVELFGPDGAPLEDGAVTLLGADESHAPVLTVLVDHGAAELPTLRERFDVEVRVTGLRVERRFDLTSPARIDLRAGIPVELALDPPLRVDPAAGTSLRFTMTPADPGRATRGGQHRVDVAGDGTGHVTFSESGRFRVELEASRAFSRSLGAGETFEQAVASMKHWLELEEQLGKAFGAPTIDVHEGAVEQRVLVPLPLGAREVLEQMMRESGGG